MTYLGCSLALSDWSSVVRLVPLSEWTRVDKNYTIFDKCLCSDKLIVTCVVYNVDDSRFSCGVLTGPGKVTVVQSKSASLQVATPNTDSSYSPDTDLGVCCWSSNLELSLHTNGLSFATGGPALVPVILRDTCGCELLNRSWIGRQLIRIYKTLLVSMERLMSSSSSSSRIFDHNE